MKPHTYVPDYIIYDELKRKRESAQRDEKRPQLEMPRYMPYWPESMNEEGASEHEESIRDENRGEVVIQMC